MKKIALIVMMGCCLAMAKTEKKRKALIQNAPRETNSVSHYSIDPYTTVGRWIASGGVGLTISPTMFLFNPQLEYVLTPDITVGPMIQLGLGDATLFNVSGTIRYTFNQNAKIKPSLEGGLGMAIGSSAYASSVGVNISVGMGCDYVVDRNFRVGTMIRGNFAPPLKTFYLSWPMAIGRFAL